MTLHQITAAVRVYKGEIVLCGPTSFGYIIRAVVSGKTCRIIVTMTERCLEVLPLEPGTETHVVSDAPSLQAWLTSLVETQSSALAAAMHP